MPNLDLKYITDENGNRVLPITHVNAVRDSNGNTLPTLMAPEKNGSGIGTCSTSSGTALTVSLTGYELVQNGIVAVTFANDVPANATLNINGKGAKPIIYKGSAIEADVIKADDTALFSYDGTNYVLISSGGSAAPVNPNETVNISLTQIGGNSADLTGASITITDDDSGDTIYTGTWAGTILSTEIDVNTNYTVSVDTITGYSSPTSQSYTAQYQNERSIGFKYTAYGVYIESTDHLLYTSSNWTGSGKTANAVVVASENSCFRIAITYTVRLVSSTSSLDNNLINPVANNSIGWTTDFNGKDRTTKWQAYNVKYTSDASQYAPYYCISFVFPDGVTTGGYFPAAVQLNIVFNNLTEINNCLNACANQQLIPLGTSATYPYLYGSTPYIRNVQYYNLYALRNNNGTYNRAVDLAPSEGAGCIVRVFADY